MYVVEEIRTAETADLPAVVEVVAQAYEPWAKSLGFRPGPMDADYAALIASGKVFVAGRTDIDAIIVLTAEDDCMLVENVAVRPAAQGQGVGRALLAFAEHQAAALALQAIRLYTHEKMASNIALYRNLGYVETGREPVPIGQLVHLRKDVHGGGSTFPP